MADSSTVLLVDDDPLARKLYRAQLADSGFVVAEASSGIEAVELAERESFAVVIMDLAMPGLDGWMAMSLIRARRPSLPIIVLTNSAGPDIERRAEQAGAAGFLTKPCSSELLKRTISKAVRHGK